MGGTKTPFILSVNIPTLCSALFQEQDIQTYVVKNVKIPTLVEFTFYEIYRPQNKMTIELDDNKCDAKQVEKDVILDFFQ